VNLETFELTSPLLIIAGIVLFGIVFWVVKKGLKLLAFLLVVGAVAALATGVWQL